MRLLRLMAFLLLMLLLVGAFTVQAQDSSVTLTLSVPQFLEDIISDELLAQFEAENPAVTVRVVSSGFGIGGSPANDLDGYLDGMLEFTSSADVLFADMGMTPEATRAGLFLDLAPLASSDSSLNVGDFLPAAWSSFQWDNGIWALPVSINITSLTYNPQAFDTAGLPYPNEAWTLNDLANAARALAETDADGNISTPGAVVLGSSALAALLRSLTGTGFYDASTLPETPDLTNPALEGLLTTWLELENEGIVARQFDGNILDLPMLIGENFGFGRPGQETSAGALLPGGAAVLTTQGYAVSSGTLYPEQAYALAKFLTNRAEVASSFFGVRPARESLVGVQPDTEGPGGFINAAPVNDEFLNSAIAVALPMAEIRYGDYVAEALNSMASEGLDAATALQEAENSVIANLQTAANQREETTVQVATPPPAVVLGEGEVSLNFGMMSFVQPLPNQEQWDQVIQEFVAADPQVAEVVVDIPGGGFFGGGGDQAADMAAQYDCFYLPYNAVPDLDTSLLLNLDPVLDADPTFDRSDIVGNTLSQVQQNAMTWALPITLQPEVLNYDPDLFAQAGAIPPENGWTTDEFVSALNTLKAITEADPPFVSQTPGSYLMMIIAAFGGLPLDYRTDPATLNFTDPATVDAIRQVLDLAKQGLIDYDEQGSGGAVRIQIITGENADTSLIPVTTQSASGPGLFLAGRQEENPYLMTTYPAGSVYTPVSYTITTGYISASAENPDACYRWLSTIARHPELFNSMPARRSLLSDPAVVAALGQDAVDFYSQYDAVIQSPNAVVFPTAFAGADQTSFILQLWLNRAFDNYVLNDGDLEADLADAQTFASAYQECAANLPPVDRSAGPEVFQQIQECVVAADPSMASLFPQPGG